MWQLFNFLFRQIALVGTTEVELVTILFRLHATQNRAELGQRHFSDTRQLVIYLLLLHFQLLFVGKLLPFTSAAYTEVLAERRYA